GEYYVDRNASLGYLAQNLDLDSDHNIYDETITVFQNLLDMEAKLQNLESEMTTEWTDDNKDWHEDIQNKYATLQDLYVVRGGQTFRAQINRVLTGLGIPESDWEKPIHVLSGGEKTRVALAKLLLSEPSIILMDEPTNHLDLAATEWLEDFLKGYKGTLLVISHDRYFLDAVTDHTYLMVHGEVLTYKAPYSGYLELHKKAYEVRLKAWSTQQDEIKRQEAIIEKYKQFNREKSIRAAESRQRKLDKIDRIEAPKKQSRAAGIQFKAGYESGNDVLNTVGLTKSFDDRTLFSDISFMIKKGDKIALIGDNGRGKTTLFNIIRQRIQPDQGYTVLGRNVSLGYYDQEQADLDPNKTVMDEVWDDFPELTTTELRTALGSFLFRGDDVFKEVGLLSGGEKCRINLLKLMLREDNFLLLDEPTNHLDIPSREALEDSLMDYDGTLFVISHDRYFLNKVIERIYELKADSMKEYLGNYSYYAEKRELPEKTQAEKTVPANSEVERSRRKVSQREERKARVRLREVEDEVEIQEAHLEDLTASLADSKVYMDPQRMKQVNHDIHKTQVTLQKLMTEWEELLAITEES
ncbi:MAG: ABC-F family ATP-binding cassette domain-containing protein, partial [Clostridium sp.]|nr:ABC-F family ATP-binding cassette domain-containing protein [Clostridium sp.]